MPGMNQENYLVTYSSETGLLAISGVFQTFSGGKTSAEVRKSFDGGKDTPNLISSSRRETDNVTIGREFDPVDDAPIVAAARTACGAERGSLSVQPLDANLLPTGNAEVYRTVLVSVTPPEADVNAKNSPARYALEFAVSSVAS